MITGELFTRTPTDIATGKIKENFYNDKKVFIYPDEKNLSRIYFNEPVTPVTVNKNGTVKSLIKKVLSKIIK